MKLSDIKLNDGKHDVPKNPRFIKDDRFKALCESLRKNGKFLEAKQLIVDENMTLLGGNMRVRALRKLGITEIPDAWVKRVEGYSVEEKRLLILLDNKTFGEDDWDALANEWGIPEMILGGFDQKKIDEMIDGLPGDEPQDAEPVDLDADQSKPDASLAKCPKCGFSFEVPK